MNRARIISGIAIALALSAVVRVGAAFAEPGSSINRLPSDDAAGPEWALPTWAGVLIFFVTPVVLILLRALILNVRGGRRAA